MEEGMVICSGALGFFVILFGFILLLRYMNYRETLALAEKGLVRPAAENKDKKGTLKVGIIIAAIGLALSVGLFPIGLSDSGPSFPLGLGPWMLAGFIPLFLGLGLVLIHVLTRKDEEKEEKANKE